MDKYAYHCMSPSLFSLHETTDAPLVFSPEMKGMRKVAFKILGPALVLTIIVMWACLPVYWGSRTSFSSLVLGCHDLPLRISTLARHGGDTG